MDNPLGDSCGSQILFLNIIKEGLVFSDWSAFGFGLFFIFILLVFSALFSASENAMFSLSPQTIKKIREDDDRISRLILRLLYDHKKLLATILIVNNFASVGFIFASTYIFNSTIFDFSEHRALGYMLQVVIITSLLVFFGEVFPKIYATSQNLRIARIMAVPLSVLSRLFYPLVFVLEKSTGFIDRRLPKKAHQLSLDDLNHAIDITADGIQSEEEKEILKGIVNFGNIPVKQIMRSRMDLMVLDSESSFKEILDKIKEWGYSRVPVYTENFDNVIGILYIKDLIPHLRKEDFNWLEVIRQPYFVPETKKLDDLMSEFQEKRVHMAIVVDEYGGTSGLVTMEDVLEEIFGEIKDEFDEDDFTYSKLDEHTYVFEGKSLIHDVCRITETDQAVFEDARGESETLGGMLCELEGRIPPIGTRIKFKHYEFLVESADKRKIKRVKMMLPKIPERKEKE